MSDERPNADRFGWTLSQRRALVLLSALFLGWLIVLTVRDRLHVSDPQPTRGVHAADLADRIDPNTADWPTLAALPQVGEKRAKAIVTYREEHQRREPHRPAFENPDDLLRIKGIGPAMVDLLTPYLVFPSTQPTKVGNHGKENDQTVLEDERR